MRKKVDPIGMAALCGMVRTMVKNGTDEELGVLIQCFVDDGYAEGQRDAARAPPQKREGLTVIDSKDLAGHWCECSGCIHDSRTPVSHPIAYYQREWRDEGGKLKSQFVAVATCEPCQLRWVRVHSVTALGRE